MLRRYKFSHWHGNNRDKSSKKAFPVDSVAVGWHDVNESIGTLPGNAYVGCILETGEEAYVARAKVESQIVTGLTTRTGLQASLPYGCVEHLVSSFQVLTSDHPDTLYWRKSSGGKVPTSSVVGGSDNGKPMYIGRTCTPLEGGVSFYGHVFTLNRHCTSGARLGKIHCPHGCLYISYNGAEFSYPNYEVLCRKESPSNLVAICKWNIFKYLSEANLEKAVIDQLPIPSPLKQYLKQ